VFTCLQLLHKLVIIFARSTKAKPSHLPCSISLFISLPEKTKLCIETAVMDAVQGEAHDHMQTYRLLTTKPFRLGQLPLSPWLPHPEPLWSSLHPPQYRQQLPPPYRPIAARKARLDQNRPLARHPLHLAQTRQHARAERALLGAAGFPHCLLGWPRGAGSLAVAEGC
jgi:hypothetical protein